MLNEFILPGMGLALTAISIPGPLQAYLINVTLRYGWRRGVLVAVSPLLTDIPIIALVVFVLGQLPDTALDVIRIVGGLLLLWIAWAAFQQWRSGANFSAGEDERAASGSQPGRVLATAMLLNALSPGPWLFWATVNGPLLIAALEIDLLHAAGFLLAFYGTFVGGLFLLVSIFNRLGQMNAVITRWLLLATVGLLIFFGTALIAEALNLTTLHRQLAMVAAVGGGIALAYYDLRRRGAPTP